MGDDGKQWVSCSFDGDEARELCLIARKNQLTLSQMVRMAVQSYWLHPEMNETETNDNGIQRLRSDAPGKASGM